MSDPIQSVEDCILIPLNRNGDIMGRIPGLARFNEYSFIVGIPAGGGYVESDLVGDDYTFEAVGIDPSCFVFDSVIPSRFLFDAIGDGEFFFTRG